MQKIKMTTEHDFSYQPLPFYDDSYMGSINSKGMVKYKLDLNLYCIKRPQQTCFIRVTNPNMLAWGIEEDDMLVVEKKEALQVGDLVVLEEQQEFRLYEFFAHRNNEYVLMALDSKVDNIVTQDWQNLPIVGTVTNTIHQIKPKKQVMYTQ
ncbi:LexA family protein [Conservatibacter flavescens]|uniref:Type VI secretion protein ImpA n=1 Tax=Conservatibacter flavescens TaxID=28161 RepID=A0A2M8S554_9PAST|nr:S24 family peptidase [Conservatibacter flavescens]PJG86276.1 type VI secretion protein ImpA [Conservatibacter flavescens]